MSNRTKLIHVQVPEALWRRAKMMVLERNLDGGISGLIRDGLTARLDEIDKIPVIFDIAFRRVVGRDPTMPEHYMCYGGRQERPGLRLMGIMQRYTLQELEDHCTRGRWDARTAVLVAEQEAHWRSVGEVLGTPLLRPPGWLEGGVVMVPVEVQEEPPEVDAFEPLE